MVYILGSSISFLLSIIILVVKSTTIYQNNYEPRVFDHIPLNCYDCLSYRDIILTQITTIPAQSFANFNLGVHDTNLIINGKLKLNFQPYAFQSLVVQKPNKTLTITFSAPNSWLNITENMFNGLDLQSYSTLHIIIKYFYGCTFHKNSLSGIKMGKYSHLIIDISSVTQLLFQNHIIEENNFMTSINFLISRIDTILFNSYSFSLLNINFKQEISFHFELISHMHLKSYSFHSLKLQSSSSFHFYSIYINRLIIDSYTFQNMSLSTNALFNLTIQTLGTYLCLKSYTFDNLHEIYPSKNIKIFLTFNHIRGISFFSNIFSNLSLNYSKNQLKIHSNNPLNDPNPIINFVNESFSSIHHGLVTLNFSSTMIIKFEQNAFKIDDLFFEIYFNDVTLVDLSLLNVNPIKTKLNLYFNYVNYVKWFQSVDENLPHHRSLTKVHFHRISNDSCLIYRAPRSTYWLFSNSNRTICNCPLLYAYKYGQLDGQLISCVNTMTGHETARKMNECHFNRRKTKCHSILESLMNLNNNKTIITDTLKIDHFLIQQLYDKNYLSCSYNYSLFRSSLIVRSHLFNKLGPIIGIIFGIFVILLILVMGLLNGLQYKMRECDETWMWRRNISWTSLRRTISQTSLRRSRRDLRTINGNVTTSKSENQLDCLRYEQADNDEHELENDFIRTQCIDSST